MKTRTARTVPLHAHLIEQGFAAFVEGLGTGPLFYAERKARGEMQPVKSVADQVRDAVGAWVRSLGLVDPELSPNHAWRHTFKARAARYEMAEVYSDAITGHAAPTVGRSYTQPTAEDLAAAMRKFPRYEV
jgi:integrase